MSKLYQVIASTMNLDDLPQVLITTGNYNLAAQVYNSACAVTAKMTRETTVLQLIEQTIAGPRDRRKTTIQPR